MQNNVLPISAIDVGTRHRRDLGDIAGLAKSWTEERKTEAERLWRDGWSADAIAAQLGAVSRNAVIGLLHRKKLARRSIALAAAQPRATTAWSAMSQAEKLALIRESLAEGLSAKAIAAMVGVPPQTVTSYGNKHGLRFVPAQLAEERRHIGSSALVIKLAAQPDSRPPLARPAPPPAPLPSLKVALLDLKAEDCRYIDGDPRAEHSYCGHPRQPGSSYCAWHHRVCYSAVSEHRPDLEAKHQEAA